MGSTFCHPSRQSPSSQLLERYSSSLSSIFASNSVSSPSNRLCSSKRRWIWIRLQTLCRWIIPISIFPIWLIYSKIAYIHMPSFMEANQKQNVQPILSLQTFLNSLLIRHDHINNFKMKDKAHKQREKERNELIFKYVKSLTPFNNPQSEHYLQKLRSNIKGDCQKDSFLLNSKVFEVNVPATKHKKRVSFVDIDPITEIKTPSKKLKTAGANAVNSSRKAQDCQQNCEFKNECSPERVQNDLLELQRSVFTTFKIKQQAKPNIFHQSIGSARTVAYDSLKPQPAIIPSVISRAKSCTTIANLGLQSSIKPSSNPATTSIEASAIASSGLDRSQSLASNPLAKSRIDSQMTNRSSTYSQHSHNLMVEIFKQKLQAKRSK